MMSAESAQEGASAAVPPFDAKGFVDSLPARPGVYRMLDAQGTILYVGKARNLKSRVGSYFQPSNVQPKVQALVAKTASMEVTITNSDTEALLLEFNLIKKHRPRFNVVLRDDKSFPYLHLETNHDFPRLNFYRGSRKEVGRFFGPYPSAGAVRETLGQLQKLFRLRNCDDLYFSNRSRPCLQYQIERCTGPCVGLISKEDYARDVQSAIKVLEGRNDEAQVELARRMETAAEQLNFEEAARVRDQLKHLKVIQSQQIVNAEIDHDADVIAIDSAHGEYAVALMFVRGGRSLGSTNFFPKAPLAELAEVLEAFVAQYYLERESPAEIIVEHDFDGRRVLEATLGERAGHKVRIASQVRGIRARWLEMMHNNAEQALKMRALARSSIESSLEELRDAFDLDEVPQRLECFDISHTGGTETVASCVVFGPEGPMKAEYRRFNIAGIQPGDDYAAMNQALTRRYKRVRDGEITAPDVLLIDGGKGQLAEAAKVLEELGVAGITTHRRREGADRRPGQEQLFTLDRLIPDAVAAGLERLAPHSAQYATRHTDSRSPDTAANAPSATASLYSRRFRAWVRSSDASC